MAIIKTVRSISRHDISNVKSGENLLDWCVENHPNCFNFEKVKTVVFCNGLMIANVDDLSADELQKSLDFTLNDADYIEVRQAPRGDSIGSAFNMDLVGGAFTLFQKTIEWLVDIPELPNDQGSSSSSPNANLKAASNQFRPRQGIPDKSGESFCVPDFIQPSYFEYVNNLKVVKELFCVGIGSYDISSIKDGEALISTITDSDANVYDNIAGDVVPASIQKTVVGSNNIDGQELNSPDSAIFRQSLDIEFIANNKLKFADTETVIQDFNLTAGSLFRVDDGVNGGQELEVSNITSLLGFITIETVETTIITEPITETSLTKLNAAGDPIYGWTDYIIIREAVGTNDVWFQVTMPQGIQDKDGNRIEIDIEMEVVTSFLGSITQTYSFGGQFAGADRSEKAQTFKLSDFFIGLVNLNQADKIEVRARRFTPEFEGSATQSVKLEEVYWVEDQVGNDFTNLTLISLERKATRLALGQRENKINCIAQRKLKLFDPNTGTVGTAYEVTRQAADYIFYVLHELAEFPLSAIDTEALFDIRDSLPSPESGYFDYSFDDKEISLEQRIETAANAMRCVSFKSGRIRSFVRDEVRPIRSALISPRIMRGYGDESFKITKPRDKDSVTIRYVDPDENVNKFIERRINQTTGAIEEGQGDNPLDIEMDFCRNEAQAINRAELEIRKIAYIMRTASVNVVADGLYVNLGDRIGWANPIDNDTQHGEILSFSAGDYDTTERFIDNGVDAYYCYTTDEDGLPTSTPFVVTARIDTEFGFSAVSGQAYDAAGYTQLGSRYIIATLDDLNFSDWTVTSRGGRDSSGSVTIELSEYNSAIYEED